MSINNSITRVSGHVSIDALTTAIDRINTTRPGYNSILSLYGPVFIAQERARVLVQLRPFDVPRERLISFQQQKTALIDKSGFMIDMASARALFDEICAIAAKSDAKELNSESALMQALVSEDIDPEPFFIAARDGDENVFNALALEYHSSPLVAEMLAYNSIQPSLTACVSMLKRFLPEDLYWQKPGCPICSNQPVLSVLDAEGKRRLVCGFCWNEWTAQRIRCPYCGETDGRKLHYQFSAKEKEYRVDVCDSCQSYIKTVDIRKLDRPFHPPLEHLVSTHIDLLVKNEHFE